ncbi:MAG TPA: alpha-amylase/4-alpha-glucanotransferase domain-containing protein [Spirochaetia bacterium]|nr:alpha-amylase/4-alpha-glucanotransferase domain-containing protein [Spirochaetia bacterium]
MGRTRLIVGTHNHLPLGRSDDSAERLYQESLKPFLAVLYRYPAFPVTLHYSGTLMEWLEEWHPEFLTLLGEMVARSQVEVLGGGYYDPILPLIPMNDKLGQLEKMTTWLRVRFQTRPRGCWLAEKVWEQSLASVLKASGMDYTFVDDGQFAIAGVEEEDLFQPFLTEDQGKILALLPVCERLCELASGHGPSDAIEFLRGVNGRREGGPGPVAVLMADGATTSARLIQGGWLEGFLQAAAENVDWLEPCTPGQYLRDNPPVRRLYIPSSSSLDIMRMALPPGRRGAFEDTRSRAAGEGGRRFVVGGHFRDFLSRYPEAWLMYAKMMNTHVLVNQVRGDKYKKKSAQNELWKGQSHHAYWDAGGVGIYENELRKAVYRALIEAEKITRATEIFAPSILSVDYDMDNRLEYLYQGSELNAYIHTLGGALFELDFLPASWNYLDTMVDRESSAEPPSPASLAAAASRGYERKAFLDHFLSPEATLQELQLGRLHDCGDFCSRSYEMVELNRALPELLLRCDGTVRLAGARREVRVEKRFVFRPRSIDVYYRLANPGEEPVSAVFGVEINISLAARSSENGRIFLLDEDRKKEISSDAAEIDGVQGLLVRDVRNEVSVTLSSVRAFRFWSIPVETADGRADHPARFQSHCFLPAWNVTLAAGETWENHLSVAFEKAQTP